MTDEQIQQMVNRFLGWKLPSDFNPDGGIRYIYPEREEWGPIGTNLFNATQATEMVRHMVDGVITADRTTSTSPSTDTELDRLLEELSPDNPFFPGQDSLKAQIKQLIARERQALVEKVSSADFVYEVMNAPTNGVARDWIKAELQAQAD